MVKRWTCVGGKEGAATNKALCLFEEYEGTCTRPQPCNFFLNMKAVRYFNVEEDGE